MPQVITKDALVFCFLFFFRLKLEHLPTLYDLWELFCLKFLHSSFSLLWLPSAYVASCSVKIQRDPYADLKHSFSVFSVTENEFPSSSSSSSSPSPSPSHFKRRKRFCYKLQQLKFRKKKSFRIDFYLS